MLVRLCARPSSYTILGVEYARVQCGFTVCFYRVYYVGVIFNYLQCVCTIVYGVVYSPSLLLYTLGIVVIVGRYTLIRRVFAVKLEEG